MSTNSDPALTVLSYTPVMRQLNKVVSDLNVQFVGIVGGEMRFNRVAAEAVSTADGGEVAPPAAHAQNAAAESPARHDANSQPSTDGDLLDRIIERISAHPELVGQIKGVDSVSLRD